MADLIAKASGDFSDAASWGEIATSANARIVLTSASGYGHGTAGVDYTGSDEQGMTLTNGLVLDGVLLFLRAESALNTFVVGLSDDGGATFPREVTVDIVDLPTVEQWVFFKFGSTYTADGGSDYEVRFKVPGTGTVRVWHDGNRWLKKLRLTSTAAPGSGDTLHVGEEHTASGASTLIALQADVDVESTGPICVSKGGSVVSSGGSGGGIRMAGHGGLAA